MNLKPDSKFEYKIFFRSLNQKWKFGIKPLKIWRRKETNLGLTKYFTYL